MLNLSDEGVRLIEVRAIRKLRKRLIRYPEVRELLSLSPAPPSTQGERGR